ncbi:DJ-1/PfpI family protein [Herbihabitans rhizosphaerae]|uniref:DJ-1/PfpI family protein n=1 Tax=Herbihabitans rhizosphaerae TaxID=1872711 RepID=A0A4Q7KDT8_9PSEU|nr:DJ-1/PfpI family protein [Herbihabitans rhizosphaerae]RZS31377.1 DJ-1/PfpI family protein [Herbihabitans rhizosphaerae]
MTDQPRKIGIVLFPDVEELDAVGPWQVLAYWAKAFPDDGYEVFTLSRDGKPVACAKGLTIMPHHSFEDAPAMEVLLHPGGRGTRPQLADESYLEWVRAQSATVPLMTSVCTGALVFAAAGLLRDRPATTYWASLDLLRELDPTIEVRPEDRFVDDGDVITSAGVSAGIDMALHLVARLSSTERAREVRRGIQYDPAPPV